MVSTSKSTVRRDASASIFAYAIAGGALATHVAHAVGNWREGVIPVDVVTADDRASTTFVETAEVPGWAATTLQAAQALEWLLGAVVLLLLSACVARMIRGEVFTSLTARWSACTSWALCALLAIPFAVRLVASGEVLHAAGLTDRFDLRLVTPQFWYLYIGMMTVSFFALVLRRGVQLQADQDGLI